MAFKVLAKPTISTNYSHNVPLDFIWRLFIKKNDHYAQFEILPISCKRHTVLKYYMEHGLMYNGKPSLLFVCRYCLVVVGVE